MNHERHKNHEKRENPNHIDFHAMRATSRAVPKLRFPEFTEPWETRELNNLAQIIDKRARADKYRLMSITSGIGLVSQLEKFGREIAGNAYKNYIVIQNNDFAYNKSATKEYPEGFIARYNGAEPGAVPNSIFLCFRILQDQASTDFLNYLFYSNLHGKWLRKFIAVGARAHGSLNVDEADLLSLPVPLPKGSKSLREQQKIADCLTSLDKIITAEAQKLDALKVHKKGLMQQLFPAEGEAVPKRRFPEFRDSGEWEEKALGQAATFLNGRAYKQEELLTEGKYRVLRVGNFFSSNNWYFSDLELEPDKYCERGDLLYAWSASFGPKIWAGEKTIYHYHIWKVEPDQSIDKRFLFAILEYETEKVKAKSANGLGMMHITKGTIEAWQCRFPKLSEQQHIADCLTSLDELITAQAEKIEALKVHKKGLMQGLFPQQGSSE